MFIEFFLIFCFDVIVNTTINFTRIVLLFAKINNNNKTLIESVVLKSFYNFFKHFESFAVDKKIQISKKYTINEFLNNKNQTEIENEKKSLSDHNNNNFENNDITKVSECKKKKKRMASMFSWKNVLEGERKIIIMRSTSEPRNRHHFLLRVFYFDDTSVLAANPNRGLLAPSNTTNWLLRKISPKMLKPMPWLDWMPPKHVVPLSSVGA